MSRPGSYTYPGMASSPRPQYYYEDVDGYGGEYGESDGLSDGSPPLLPVGNPDMTEIYRRKAIAVPLARSHYSHYLPDPSTEYYYESIPPPQFSGSSPTYRKRLPVITEQPRYYSPERHELYSQAPNTYRSSHQLVTSLPRTAIPASIPSATIVRPSATIRRHPITVRTPRYYRRPTAPALVKRPSALCLPVACQPDPAVYNKRTKRVVPQDVPHLYPPDYAYPPPSHAKHHQQQHQYSMPAATAAPPADKLRAPAKKPSLPDYGLAVTRSKLDATLERYEQLFERNVVDFAGNPPDINLVRMMKPKVPSTVKERQEKHMKQHQFKTETEEVTSDALEDMLFADLQANGFTNNDSGDFKRPSKDSSQINSDRKEEKTPRSIDGTIGSEKNLKDLPKSFNYDEIQSNLAKTKHSETPSVIEEEPSSFEAPEQDVPNIVGAAHQNENSDVVKQQSIPNVASQTENAREPATFRPFLGSQESSHKLNENDRSCESVKSSLRSATVPRVLVDDALELHRTKSYVVNLIDHALSNQFGTNLCEKYSTKENPIDHRVAVEILKKHSAGKMDKELCVEIAQALADTFNSSATSCTAAANQPNHDCEPKHQASSTCSCSKMSDEPLYVKQLKQLRWGHLKHIQREVRRLEDLERFLDSCSSNSYV